MKVENLKNLIVKNQDRLLESIHENVKVYFDGIFYPQKYDNIISRYTKLARPLFSKQAEKACAIEKFLFTNKSCIVNLDTGYGKTAISIAVASSPKYKNIFIVSPPHLVSKWNREIYEVLSKKNIKFKTIIVKSYKDILSLTKASSTPSNNIKTFFIVSKTLNSNSIVYKPIELKRLEYSFIKIRNRIRIDKYMYTLQCPICYNKIKVVAKNNLKKQRIRKCENCNSELNSPQKGKISPAEFIRRYGIKNGIDLLIVDEIHEEKSKDSNRSKALGYLVSKSQNILGLTGSFLGGYASHAFFTLFKLYPEIFKKNLGYSWEDVNKFVTDYGSKEKIYKAKKLKNSDLEIIRKNPKTKERADLSPKLLDILLPTVLFGKIDEITFPNKNQRLPKYVEVTHIIKHDKELRYSYLKFIEDIKESFISTGKINYHELQKNSLLIPDTPFQTHLLRYVCDNKNKTIVYSPNINRLKYPLTNKENKLLEIITNNLKEGRKCLVYYDYVNSELNHELKKIIMLHTEYKADILSSKVLSKNREEYIRNLDCDVLITNPELVKTGLDLIEFPCIIFYQQSYQNLNAFSIRQAAKRSWRIGQSQDCEVHFLAYSGTTQKVVLDLMGAKINVSQGVEGKLSHGVDLASHSEIDNTQIQLARSILNLDLNENNSFTSLSNNTSVENIKNKFENYYEKKLQEVKNEYK